MNGASEDRNGRTPTLSSRRNGERTNAQVAPSCGVSEVINHGFWMFFGNIVIISNPQKKEMVIDHCLSSWELPSGKRLHNVGKSQCFMGKSTINGNFQ